MNKPSTHLQRDLRRLGSHTAWIYAATAILMAYASHRANLGLGSSIEYQLSLLLAALPLSLIIEARLALWPKQHSRPLSRRTIHAAIATALAVGVGELTLVLLSYVGSISLHVPIAIHPVQLLLLDVAALSFPLASLAWDHTTSEPRPNARLISFGLLAGLLTYLNYLCFYARSSLDPRYLDASLPACHQAANLSLITLILCCITALFFDRAHHHDQFWTTHLTANRKLLSAIGLVSLVLLTAIYTPVLQPFTSSTGLSILDWLSVLCTALIYAACRLLQRHTRQHSRAAVLKLHSQR